MLGLHRYYRSGRSHPSLAFKSRAALVRALFVDSGHGCPGGLTQTPIQVFGLEAFLRRLDDTGWYGPKGTRVKIEVCCSGRHFLANAADVCVIGQDEAPS